MFVSRDKDGAGPYDLGEFDQALFLYLDGQNPNSSSSLQEQNGEFGFFAYCICSKHTLIMIFSPGLFLALLHPLCSKKQPLQEINTFFFKKKIGSPGKF